jgi:hypothetical protein
MHGASQQRTQEHTAEKGAAMLPKAAAMMYVPGKVVIFESQKENSNRQYCCVCGTWNISSCKVVVPFLNSHQSWHAVGPGMQCTNDRRHLNICHEKGDGVA